MAHTLRHSICNEVFENWDFAEACQAIRAAGYTGIEISPFTLAERPEDVSAERRAELRRMMADTGLAFVGLHWLMVSPKGLHVTTPDLALRARSWEHIRRLIDLCADLGGDSKVMIFGSPSQRSSTGGLTPGEATRNWVDGLASVADEAASKGVTILVEALPKNQSDIVNTLDEAAAIVREIASPGVQAMFDTHNAVDETEPHPVVVERHLGVIRHVHVNEIDGRYCGTGDYDFGAVFEVLSRNNYPGWVSLEVFDFKPDPVTIATESLRYLRGL